jgi:flagellar basal-body rod modification protein FlgD
MISSVTSTTDSTSTSSTMKTTFGMDSNDFLKLFVTQLQYQDPLSPQDASAMLDQLAQITLVEQSYNTNTALNNLLTAQNNSLSTSSVSFIGKTIKANGDDLTFDGSTAVSLQYNLSAATSGTTITIKNSSGETVRTITLDAQSSGDLSYSWDGCNDSGTTVSAGAYTFSVSGTSTSGTSVTGTTYSTGVVDGVNYSGDTPYLTIGSIQVPLTDVISVSGT